MNLDAVPIFLFATAAAVAAVGLLLLGRLFGPGSHGSRVQQMPYESGVDPLHDTRRRFDVRFHLVAIAFLVFDVELLFLYPWAVASRNPEGIDAAVREELISRGVVFGEVAVFVGLLTLGFVYAWRKGVFQWK